jgi:hypothetical protein
MPREKLGARAGFIYAAMQNDFEFAREVKPRKKMTVSLRCSGNEKIRCRNLAMLTGSPTRNSIFRTLLFLGAKKAPNKNDFVLGEMLVSGGTNDVGEMDLAWHGFGRSHDGDGCA